MSRFLIMCLLMSSWVFSQNQNQKPSPNKNLSERDKMIQEFMRDRRKMMDQMLQAFGEDDFFADDFGADRDDDFFKGILGSRFQSTSGLGVSLVNIKRIQKDNGEIEIYLKPKDKSITMEFETTTSAIIVKAKQGSKVENNNKLGIQSSMSQSQFTRSISIPLGFKASAAKALGDRVLIVLKPAKKKSPSGRVPIQKPKGETSI